MLVDWPKHALNRCLSEKREGTSRRDVSRREGRMEGTSGRFDYPRVWGTRKLIKKHIRAKERRSLGDVWPRQLEQLCRVPYQTLISANLWQSLQLPCAIRPNGFLSVFGTLSQACALHLPTYKKYLGGKKKISKLLFLYRNNFTCVLSKLELFRFLSKV